MNGTNINYVAVAKNCGRTAGVAEVIDGASVSGVQLWAPKIDLGTPALTYYGLGEVLITDNAGKALTATTAVKSVESIVIHARSANGLEKHRSKEIRGKDVTSYHINKYIAASECFAGISGIDATLLDHVYMLTIRLEPSRARVDYCLPEEVTVTYRSSVSGNTEAEIYAGLAEELNLYYGAANGENFTILATAVATGIHIVALENSWNPESRVFHQTRFTVVMDDDAAATIVSNLAQEVTFLTVVYPKATKGAGTYKLVSEAEFDAQRTRGVNRNADQPSMLRPYVVPLNAVEFQSDGVTPMQYDELVLNWNYTANNTLTGTNQRGRISIFLPVEDNTTNQVGVASTGIVPVIDKFVETEFGVTKIGDIS